jgi:hypothetical protein
MYPPYPVNIGAYISAFPRGKELSAGFKKDPSYQSEVCTIESYEASVGHFYNATGSLLRFENKNILSYFQNRPSIHVNSKVVGSAMC